MFWLFVIWLLGNCFGFLSCWQDIRAVVVSAQKKPFFVSVCDRALWFALCFACQKHRKKKNIYNQILQTRTWMGILLAYLFFCLLLIFIDGATRWPSTSSKINTRQWCMQIIKMQNTSISVVFFRVPIDYLFNLHKNPYKKGNFFYFFFISIRFVWCYYNNWLFLFDTIYMPTTVWHFLLIEVFTFNFVLHWSIKIDISIRRSIIYGHQFGKAIE